MASGARARQAAIAVLILCAALPARVWLPFGPLGSFSVLDVVLLAGAALLFLHAFITGRLHVGHRTILALLCVPLAASLLSLAWSHDRGTTVRTSIIFFEAVVAYLLVVNVFRNCEARRIVGWLAAFVVVCVAVSAASLLRLPGLEPQVPPNIIPGTFDHLDFLVAYYSRLSHPYIGVSNNLAGVLAFFVLIFLAWGWATGERRYLFVGLFTLLATLMTLSRGVLFAGAIVGVLFLFERRVLRALPSLAVGGAVIAASFAAYYLFAPDVSRHFRSRTSATTVDIRLEKAQIGLAWIAESPLLGYGAGVVARDTPEIRGGVHNTFLQQMLDVGIPLGTAVGAALLLLTAPFFLWPSGSGQVRFLARACGFSVLGQLLIFLSQTSFEGAVTRVLFYFSVGAAVALLAAYSREEAARP